MYKQCQVVVLCSLDIGMQRGRAKTIDEDGWI